MKLVVDTNIVFSGILSPNGTICDLLLNSQNIFDFYAPSALLDELGFHHQKLLKLSGLWEEELNFLKQAILKKIDFMDLESLRPSTWEQAVALTKHVDEFDAPFIALSLELESPLWTGDKRLIEGLKQKGIDWILNTETIKEIRGER